MRLLFGLEINDSINGRCVLNDEERMSCPLITVIIPVYNVERFLSKCIDSVLNQTYKNTEIILIDDGSPDNSPKICDEYAKKDRRVNVINQTNTGVSAARNSGLKIAKGE